MEDRYLFKAKHIHVLPNNNRLDGSWVVGFLSGERYIANDSGEYLIDPSTICQCTGLKDKNGKLIWENDIVEYRDCTTEHYVIAYEYDKACFEYQQYSCSMMNFEELSGCEVEVVGNIFDNPELLESEESNI
nr:MAG: YopX protein [Bacteriophage sp.]